MVLVAPRPLQSAAGGGVAAGGGGGADVLSLLRGDASRRPRFDPGLAGGLRAWLEDAAYGVVGSRGELVPPLVLGPRDVLGPGRGEPAEGAEPVGRPGGRGGGAAFHSVPEQRAEEVPSEDALLGRLVHMLFRLMVTGGTLGDPWRDALDGLVAEGSRDVVRQCEQLDERAQALLAERVAAHANHLDEVLPRLAPGWMPRTDDRVAIPLAGGRVVLQGVFDLLVGVPRRGEASLCALGLATGVPWAWERRSLHFLALLETLRSGAPPFRIAVIESATGRFGVEDVREDHVRALASHLTGWLANESRRAVQGADA
jgi:hypothetical protein